MPCRQKWSIYAKWIVYCTVIPVLSFIGTYFLIEKGIPGLNVYKEEQKYKPSGCKMDRFYLSPNGEVNKYVCAAINEPYTYFNQCQEWLHDTQVSVSGRVMIYVDDNHTHTNSLRYTTDDSVSIVLKKYIKNSM